MKTPIIGTLAEKGLHGDIKDYLLQPGDILEREVGGYVADIYRGGQLIEIQTGNFGKMRRKLFHLLERHPIHLVHPIAAERIIVREDADGREVSRRKSPRKGTPLDIFIELVSIRDLVMHPNLTLEILMIVEEEFRRQGPGRRRRGGWHTHDRRLVEVLESINLASLADFRGMLPEGLSEPFTNRDLADTAGCSIRAAGATTYTLRGISAIREAGKRGRAVLYI